MESFKKRRPFLLIYAYFNNANEKRKDMRL